MSDKKNASADGDRVRQLLAQLRAKFDLEDESALSLTEPEEEESLPQDEAPTVSFALPSGAEENGFSSQENVTSPETETLPEESADQTLDMSEEPEKPEVPEEPIEFADKAKAPHEIFGQKTEPTEDSSLRMTHAGGESFGSDTITFFLQRYDIHATDEGDADVRFADVDQRPIVKQSVTSAEPPSSLPEQQMPTEDAAQTAAEETEERIDSACTETAEETEEAVDTSPSDVLEDMETASTEQEELLALIAQGKEQSEEMLSAEEVAEANQFAAVFRAATAQTDEQSSVPEDADADRDTADLCAASEPTQSDMTDMDEPACDTAESDAAPGDNENAAHDMADIDATACDAAESDAAPDDTEGAVCDMPDADTGDTDDGSPLDYKNAPTDYGIVPDPHPPRVPSQNTAAVPSDASATDALPEQPETPSDEEPISLPPSDETPAPSDQKPAVTAEPLDIQDDDFMAAMPDDVKGALSDNPLGMPSKIKPPPVSPLTVTDADVTPTAPQRETPRAPEEPSVKNEYRSHAQVDAFRLSLARSVRHNRVRLLLAAILTFALLLLENIRSIGAVVPSMFQHGQINALLVIAVLSLLLLICMPELIKGAKGILHGKLLPESLLLAEGVLCLGYAVVEAVLLKQLSCYAFVAGLGYTLLLFFASQKSDCRTQAFSVLSTPGDKLVFSAAKAEEAAAEMNVLGMNIETETPHIFRIRKTNFIDGFVARTEKDCEDHRFNLWLLVASAASALLCGLIAFLLGATGIQIASACLLAFMLALPLCMCASHIYPYARAVAAAGNDSALLGESTIAECADLNAVSFEDIEAIPSKNVRITHIKMYAGNVDQVLYYVSGLFHLVGGPLRGYFGRSTKEMGYARDVMLEEAVPGGLCATVEGQKVLVGDGDYMLSKKIGIAFDPEDARQLESGRVCIMYAAINGSVCAKFYVQYLVSAAFERNVKHLHRRGIATVIRTYDPNISERLLLRISALSDYRVHVVSKTAAQHKDFAAPHLSGGIITTADSGKLLRLLFLCLRTRGVILGEKVLKGATVACGVLAAVLLTVFGLSWHLSSVWIGVYHLIFMLIAVLWARCRIFIKEHKK